MIKTTFKKNAAYIVAAFLAILALIALLRYEKSGVNLASIIEFYIPFATRLVFASILLFFTGKFHPAMRALIFINALCLAIEHLFELYQSTIIFDAVLEDIILAIPFILIMLSFIKPRKYVLSVLAILAMLASLYSLTLHITIIHSLIGGFSKQDIKEYLVPTVIYASSALLYWISVIIYNIKKEASM